MQPYRSMSFPEGGHIQNKHFQKPLRKLRKSSCVYTKPISYGPYVYSIGAGMLQPKYLRDQFRLPQCMTPRQIRRQRKGNLPKYFDVSGPVAVSNMNTTS